MAYASIDQSVARGDADLGLNGLEDTPARRAAMAVTVPYYEFREVLSVRSSDATRLRTLADLAGRRVGTLGGTMAYDILLAAGSRYRIEAISYDDDVHPYRICCSAVSTRCCSTTSSPSDGVRQLTGVTVQPHVRSGRALCRRPGARSNGALRDQVSAALVAAMRDGSLEQILRKWRVWNDDQPALYAQLLDAGRADAGIRSRRGRPCARRNALAGDAPYLPTLVRAAGDDARYSHACRWRSPSRSACSSQAVGYTARAPLRLALTGYVELMRGTPILLQLFVIYYGIAAAVRLPAFAAALAGLALNYAAYESEIYRGALEAVPTGQLEAARTLGFTERQILTLVRGPQAFRLALAADDERLRRAAQGFVAGVRAHGRGADEADPDFCRQHRQLGHSRLALRGALSRHVAAARRRGAPARAAVEGSDVMTRSPRRP